MNQRKLTNIHTFRDPGSRGFTVTSGAGEKVEIFIVLKDGAFTGWLNHCPHKGMPLEWRPDDFLDDEGEHIICATHGAIFDIEDGSCLGGPCRGHGLSPVPLEQRGEILYLASESDLEIIPE
jgi:nitrite reductase/ring-hydroxylating ferredoxin subunit